MSLESGLRNTADTERSGRWMRVFHGAKEVVVWHLQNCGLRGFVLKTMVLDEINCVLLLIMYCCNSPDV